MLKCYGQGRVMSKLVPARPHRDWMERYPGRHAYRCLPLAVANTFGWELLSPCDLKIEWNGGSEIAAIKITAEDGFPLVNDFAVSNFAYGIVTFHTGYLFVTDPGWLMFATGPINDPIDGMAPLTGLIETDWLPYPFGMNWQLMRPGTYRIKKDQPYCHIMPVQVEPLLQTVPEILEVSTNPDLEQRMDRYRQTRIALRENQKTMAADGSDAPSWSKEYFHGRLGDGTAATKHYQKIRMAEPVDKRAYKVEQEILREALLARQVSARPAGPAPTYGIGTFGYSQTILVNPPKGPKPK